ncbi:MAG: hypothetical protein ACJ749_15910 [Flavisolibacter sp.]
MPESKIHLSSAETQLMLNAEIILTKNSVLQKIKSLLEELQQEQNAFIREEGLQTNEPFFISPKISKGENYQGLPYIILDYPRITNEKNFFLARSMFWWGHYFSSTIHLSGSFKNKYGENIRTAYQELQDYYIAINSDQWIHHFEEDNYKKIGSLTPDEFRKYYDRFEHVKIAAKWPLDKWQEASSELFVRWKFLMDVCGLIS